MAAPPQPACGTCGAIQEDLLRCAACKAVYYCSPAHQREHWPTHRDECRRICDAEAQALRAEETQAPNPPKAPGAPLASQRSSCNTASAPQPPPVKPSASAPSGAEGSKPASDASRPPRSVQTEGAASPSPRAAETTAETLSRPFSHLDLKVHAIKRKDEPWRVVLLAPGSQGDVLPLLAVGCSLQAKGARVLVACNAPYERQVRERGLQFHLVAGDPHTGRGGQATTGPEAEQLWDQQLKDYEAAVQGAHLICFNWFGIAGLHLAEALRVPCCALWLVPFTRTAHFPSFFFYDPKMKGTLAGIKQKQPKDWCLYTHNLFAQMMWVPFSKTINDWREKSLCLPPIGDHGHFIEILRRRMLVLYGWSPTVLPSPSDWPQQHIVCGYFEDQTDSAGQAWTPTEELEAFVHATPAPLYLGLGSTNIPDPKRVVQAFVKAASALGQRLLIVGSLGKSVTNQDPEKVFVADYVPHTWLLPRMACIAHHGGAGTTGAAFKAGVPQIVCPVEYDQFFWADKVASAGVAPAMLEHASVTTAQVQAAMTFVLKSETVSKAQQMGFKLRDEMGADYASEALMTYANQLWEKLQENATSTSPS